MFEKSAKPFDRSIELTKKNWLFIFLLFLFFSFQVMGAVFLGAIVRLIYNVSIPNGFFPAAADYTRVAVGLGMILFVLLITPVIIMFDYEFYRYCLENYKKDIAGTPGFKWGKGFLKP
ncbi:MAG: hypothetical protein GY757_05000 [bacterium]|nr:hypothetical protein [bacterium]